MRGCNARQGSEQSWGNFCLSDEETESHEDHEMHSLEAREDAVERRLLGRQRVTELVASLEGTTGGKGRVVGVLAALRALAVGAEEADENHHSQLPACEEDREEREDRLLLLGEVSSRAEQLLDRVDSDSRRLALGLGDGRQAPAIDSVGVGAVGEQKRDQLRVALGHGQVQRGALVPVAAESQTEHCAAHMARSRASGASG